MFAAAVLQMLGLGQALEQDSGDLILRQGRNEQGMAHAAIGFAKQNLRKKIYACTSSVGPDRKIGRASCRERV